MPTTKKKIIETTISLFNQHGFANVSLPQIAKELEISLGNLTYHFPKKSQLILSIYEGFGEELAAITQHYRSFVDLEEMDRQMREFYQFQQRYQFFYLDLLELERAYPDLEKRHHQHIEEQISGLYNYFLFNIGSGNLKVIEDANIYRHLARQFWMTMVFWPMQLAVRGKKGSVEQMVESAWIQLVPYLTKKGKENLNHIFKTEKTT